VIAVILGIVVIIIAVVEWFGHITVPHALAILTGLVGIMILLGGFGERGGRYTRL
jgi:hypothetical protein